MKLPARSKERLNLVFSDKMFLFHNKHTSRVVPKHVLFNCKHERLLLHTTVGYPNVFWLKYYVPSVWDEFRKDYCFKRVLAYIQKETCQEPLRFITYFDNIISFLLRSAPDTYSFYVGAIPDGGIFTRQIIKTPSNKPIFPLKMNVAHFSEDAMTLKIMIRDGTRYIEVPLILGSKRLVPYFGWAFDYATRGFLCKLIPDNICCILMVLGSQIGLLVHLPENIRRLKHMAVVNQYWLLKAKYADGNLGLLAYRVDSSTNMNRIHRFPNAAAAHKVKFVLDHLVPDYGLYLYDNMKSGFYGFMMGNVYSAFRVLPQRPIIEFRGASKEVGPLDAFLLNVSHIPSKLCHYYKSEVVSLIPKTIEFKMRDIKDRNLLPLTQVL